MTAVTGHLGYYRDLSTDLRRFKFSSVVFDLNLWSSILVSTWRVLTSLILESSQSQPVIEDGTGELLMSGGESCSLSSNSPVNKTYG